MAGEQSNEGTSRRGALGEHPAERGHLHRVIDGLEATFDATLARAEDEAASDLALSLLQDAHLGDELRRGAWTALRPGRLPQAVVILAEDYVVTEDGAAIRLSSALFVRDESGRRRPRDEDGSFLELLRRHVREGVQADVSTSAGALRGRLVRACVDHVALSTGGAGLPETLVPMAAIEAVRVVEPGGPW